MLRIATIFNKNIYNPDYFDIKYSKEWRKINISRIWNIIYSTKFLESTIDITYKPLKDLFYSLLVIEKNPKFTIIILYKTESKDDINSYRPNAQRVQNILQNPSTEDIKNIRWKST